MRLWPLSLIITFPPLEMEVTDPALLSLEAGALAFSGKERLHLDSLHLPSQRFFQGPEKQKANPDLSVPSQAKPCSLFLQLRNKSLLTSLQGATFGRSRAWSPHWTCGASAQLSGPEPRTACRYTDPNLLSPAKGRKEAEVAEHGPGIMVKVPEYVS